jgi:hypothetical protein
MIDLNSLEDKKDMTSEAYEFIRQGLAESLGTCPVSGEPCDEYDNCKDKNYCHLK